MNNRARADKTDAGQNLRRDSGWLVGTLKERRVNKVEPKATMAKVLAPADLPILCLCQPKIEPRPDERINCPEKIRNSILLIFKYNVCIIAHYCSLCEIFYCHSRGNGNPELSSTVFY